ncbi:MAG: sulfotransferase family 2 domain-containing protein [Bacteroidetes bacterium]|nr:sulfotransferase family 2 domain-containing protein [Bacteroidota bacterium]
MNPDKIIFLHIPKTAGTTLHTVMARNYPKKNILTINAIRWPEKLETLEGRKKESVKILTGHVPFGAHEFIDGKNYEYFTLLREPIDRTISHYYQVLRTPQHHFAKQMAEKKYSLKQLMDSGDLLYVDNLQTRMISGDLRIPYGSVNENTLQKALDNIEKHFSVVGLQNKFDETLLLIAEHYHWKFPWYRRQQISKNRVRVADLDKTTLDSVIEYNRIDQKLFEIINQKMEATLREEGNDFKERVEKFRRRNLRFTKLINAIPFFPKVRGE